MIMMVEQRKTTLVHQVKIKSPGAENATTAARRRLESYAEANLPRLLGARTAGAKLCEQRADKATDF